MIDKGGKILVQQCTMLRREVMMQKNTTRELIERYGIRAEEIAFRLGASINSVRNWKAGRVNPLPLFQRQLNLMLRRKQAN